MLCLLEVMIPTVINSVRWHLFNQNSPLKNTLVAYSLNVFLNNTNEVHFYCHS